MKSAFVYILFLLEIFANTLGSDLPYAVPDPHIEAYSPKGLRVSIPDDKDIRSVKFFFSFKRSVVFGNDPGQVSKTVDAKDGSYWVYWNPSIELRPRDVIQYSIKVLARGTYAAKEGSYTLDRVISLADNSVITDVAAPPEPDCDETGQQIIMPSLPSTDSMEERNLGISGNKKLTHQSSYSMLKSVNSKPITRSSTIKTSGTFYVRPEGHVEASGYKEASSYDSTRQEGEQWQHSKSDLSQSDFQNLNLLHGFPNPMALSSHPSNGAVRGYHQETSYSSSSTHSKPIFSSSSTGQLSSSDFGESQLQHVVPPSSGGYTSVNSYERKEETNSMPLAVNPIKFGSTNIDHTNANYYNPSRPGYNVRTEYERHESSSSSAKSPESTFIIDSRPQSNYKPYVVPINTQESIQKGTIKEFNLGPVKSVLPPPKYIDVIFTSPISPSPTSPQSCRVTDRGHRTASQIDVVELERTVNEVQCLAAFAETTAREEARVFRNDHDNLVQRLEHLEHLFKKFREECRCR